jgi:hypothetical protein
LTYKTGKMAAMKSENNLQKMLGKTQLWLNLLLQMYKQHLDPEADLTPLSSHPVVEDSAHESGSGSEDSMLSVERGTTDKSKVHNSTPELTSVAERRLKRRAWTSAKSESDYLSGDRNSGGKHKKEKKTNLYSEKGAKEMVTPE